ncbi:MAG: type II secretion system F family protein [Campylobacterales bacterium]|nr:type II secretion system F family protein [Campylobacterales bacterium]
MKKYKIFYQKENKVLSYIVESKDIKNEKLKSNIIRVIKLKSFISKNISSFLIFLFITKLNRVLQVNITLSEAILILKRSEKNKDLLFLINDIHYSLEKGNTISEVLENYNFKNKTLIISFFAIASKKGNAKLVINSLYKLMKNIYKVNRDFLNALKYPLILCLISILCFTSIFVFVLPNLEVLFQSYENLPFSTEMLFLIKNIFLDYSIFVLLSIFIFTILFIILLKKNDKIILYFDKILFLYFPIFRKLIYYKNMFIFFEAVNTMQKLNYEINIAIKSSLALIKNKYFLDRMSSINEDLENGLSISKAFEKTKIFDETTLSLLDLGQNSNTLDFIIKDIVKIYKKDFNKIVKNISLLIEPIFFIILSLFIIWIVLAIFQPIWNITEIIN